MNLEIFNLENIDTKKVKENPQAVNQVLSWIRIKTNNRNKR